MAVIYIKRLPVGFVIREGLLDNYENVSAIDRKKQSDFGMAAFLYLSYTLRRNHRQFCPLRC